MKYLLLLLTLTLLSPTTHAQKITDPNAHLGLDPDEIDWICASSKVLATPLFKGVPNLTSFEETLYLFTEKKQLLYSLHKQNAKLPDSSKLEIGELWNARLNQIYCPIGADFSLDGYIELQLLMSGQTAALYAMYAGKNNAYGLNVNRLLKKDPYASVADAEWLTLADIVKDYIEHPVGQMNQRQQLRKRFDTFYKFITENWGGKHASQLSPQEFEAAKAKAIGN
jgi:hypothetical protein